MHQENIREQALPLSPEERAELIELLFTGKWRRTRVALKKKLTQRRRVRRGAQIPLVPKLPGLGTQLRQKLCFARYRLNDVDDNAA